MFTHPNRLLGHATEVRSQIVLAGMRRHSFNIDSARIGALNYKIDQLFQITCNELNRLEMVKPDPSGDSQISNSSQPGRPLEVRDYFEWNNERIRIDCGIPVLRNLDRLPEWLKHKHNTLFDIHNIQPCISLNNNGFPPLNPENWGYWAACDRQLWHWRQLNRLAELMHVLNGKPQRISPRYETVPFLRTSGPNLQAYRALKSPIFVPKKGYVFLTGKLQHLSLRCMVSVCLQKYLSSSKIRYDSFLFDHLRWSHDEQTINSVVSEVLYGHYKSYQQGTAEVCESRYREAVKEFRDWGENNHDRYNQWNHLTDLLLKICHLNLPLELLRRYLELENSLSELQLPIEDWHKLWSVFETRIMHGFLEPFSKDASLETIVSKLDLSLEEGGKKLLDPAHTENPGPTLRNFKAKKGHPLQKLLKRYPDVIPDKILSICSSSLSGRLAFSSESHAQARTQEVLMTQEDVMLTVAYQLIKRDYRLIGFTCDEFVLEIESEHASAELCKEVENIVSTSAASILEKVPMACSINCVETW